MGSGSTTYKVTDATLSDFINNRIPTLIHEIQTDPGYYALQGFLTGTAFATLGDGIGGYGELLPGGAGQPGATDLQKAFGSYSSGVNTRVQAVVAALEKLRSDLVAAKDFMDNGEKDAQDIASGTFMSDMETVLNALGGGASTTTSTGGSSTPPPGKNG